MMGHPYYRSAANEQREAAIERDRMEAIRFLAEQRNRPVKGRVLEAIH